jgi:hypothetical protein
MGPLEYVESSANDFTWAHYFLHSALLMHPDGPIGICRVNTCEIDTQQTEQTYIQGSELSFVEVYVSCAMFNDANISSLAKIISLNYCI